MVDAESMAKMLMRPLLQQAQYSGLSFLESDIAAALQAAYAAGLEDAARTAESFIPSGFRDGSRGGELFGIARDDRARTIAAAIRALAR